MKLEYRILWIEDDETWLRVPRKKIEKEILDYGFIPCIKPIFNCDISQLDLMNYDMIFVDYNLDKCSPKQYGNKILEQLRSKNIFADAIFYSSSNIDNLYSKVKESDLVNVSVMPRDIFNPENIKQVVEIIKYFLKKQLDLNTMRGIMMAEVANFDNYIWDIIEKLKEPEDIISHTKEKRQKNNEDFDKLTNEQLWEKLKDKNLSTIYLTSGARGTYLKNIIKDIKEEDEEYNKFYECLKKYYDEISETRNQLAHRENITAGDEMYFIDVRKNIIKHKENLIKLKEKLNV